jgi:Domain of unknown function DUF11
VRDGRRNRRLRRGAWVGVGVVAGLLGLSVFTLETASPAPNDEKVRICHATHGATNPYVSEEPAIANNGDLQGGHLDHTGPIFPTPDWGDIIPPYTYTDENGVTRIYPGYNWSETGQGIWQNACDIPPDPITPIVECVELRPNGGFVAHFGYQNPNSTIVVGPLENIFEPLSANGNQPLSFSPGRVRDAFQVESTGVDLTWKLTGNRATASRQSTECQASITIVKVLNPSRDPGRFALEIDGVAVGGATAVGDGGTTGAIAVNAGQHTVGESAAQGTNLALYDVQINCLNGVLARAARQAAQVTVSVRKDDALQCTITNTRKQEPKPVTPVLECVVFANGVPDRAVWGYLNPNAFPVEIPLGPTNAFSPAPANRGQPVLFEPGQVVGQFQTPFAGATTLTWTLGAATASAGSGATRCTATLELRKVTEPAGDPGVFNLLVNGRVLATGPNGTSTGPVTVGVGEGTASETAGPGTDLAAYESRVDCTRNGTLVVSVPGTKVDGAVANGDVVVCTFTNRRLPAPLPPPPSPPGNQVDLVVVKKAAPTTVVLGGTITWTVTVTNNSSVQAEDVNVVKVSERTYRLRVVSVHASQGTCGTTSCDLGRLAPGASATITVVTRATRVGTVLNVVRVGSEEQESDYLNNIASALVRVTAPLDDATKDAVKAAAANARCRTLEAVPRVLQSGTTSIVLATARNRFGKPVRGVAVRLRGLGLDRNAKTNARGIVRFVVTPTRTGLVHFERPARVTTGVREPCRTLLGVLSARATLVTG